MKEKLYQDGLKLINEFCRINSIPIPEIIRLKKGDELYELATCAYYRHPTIRIMVEKCASPGMGGRLWSWPGYVIDRTPYGVLQHELAHHMDTLRSQDILRNVNSPDLSFSETIHKESLEKPMTGYTTQGHSRPQKIHWFMEWFAENFRVFVTNPDLCKRLRPKFYKAIVMRGIKPVIESNWLQTLEKQNATQRIIEMAGKKIDDAQSLL
jgi:hypothetical protein